MTKVTATAEAYQAAFEAERVKAYPVADAFEAEMGYAADRAALEDAASVLACPVKANPPNWQHGRVIYAAARRYFEQASDSLTVLDIGTAKGFSALCLLWAMDDAKRYGQITSVDVLDPVKAERRNTIAEVGGLLTLSQILEPWPETERVTFLKSTGIQWLQRPSVTRVHVAFVDGKHSYDAVAQESETLASKQQAGDLVIFDDVQIADVSKAVARAEKWYAVRYLQPMPGRRYAVGTRRG